MWYFDPCIHRELFNPGKFLHKQQLSLCGENIQTPDSLLLETHTVGSLSGVIVVYKEQFTSDCTIASISFS